MQAKLSQETGLRPALTPQPGQGFKSLGVDAVVLDAFPEYGPLGLKPLSLQDVAAEAGLYESTISRVSDRQSAQTPLGWIERYRFLSDGLAPRDGGTTSVSRAQFRVKSRIKFEPAGRPAGYGRGEPVCRRHEGEPPGGGEIPRQFGLFAHPPATQGSWHNATYQEVANASINYG